jgi:hypothetical protein
MFCAPRLVFDRTGAFGPVFFFYAPGLIFGDIEGTGVLFSCFTLFGSFHAVPRASGTVFKFCALGLIFDSTEGFESRFHILRYQTLFGRYRGRWVPFTCFALPNSFSTVSQASGLVCLFCAPVPVLGGIEGIRSSFYVLCGRIHLGRYRVRRVPFSCFSLSYSFLTLPRASVRVFMFCAPGLIFDGTEGAGSRFPILRSRIRLGRYRARRVSFSCFALTNTFLAVPRASGPVFMFCAL